MKRPLPIKTTMWKSAINPCVNRAILCIQKDNVTNTKATNSQRISVLNFQRFERENKKQPNAGPRHPISFRPIRRKGSSNFSNFDASTVAETDHRWLFLRLKVTWPKQENGRISNHRATQKRSIGAFGSKLNFLVPICAGHSYCGKKFRNTTLSWLYISLS